MEKKQKHLIATIILLVALVLMYFGVKVLVDKKEQREEEQSEAKKIYVTDFNVEDVCKVSYSYSEEDVELELEDDKWKSVTDVSLNIDTSKVEELIGYYNNLEVESVISDAKDNEEYGIATPTKELTITLNNGDVYKYTFGSLNDVTSIYYMTLNDSEDVYVVKTVAASKFEKSISDLEEETTTEEDTQEDTSENTSDEETSETEEDNTSQVD